MSTSLQNCIDRHSIKYASDKDNYISTQIQIGNKFEQM